LNGKTAWSSAFQKETFSDKKAETASNFLFQWLALMNNIINKTFAITCFELQTKENYLVK